MCKLSLAAKSHADSADNFSHRLSHQEIIKLFFVGLCWILAALTEDMPADRKNCTKLHLLLRCAMLGRVMMPIGTASCTACNTRFIISPSPSGLPYGLPFGREHFVVVERQNTARPFTWHAASLQGGIAVVATKNCTKLHLLLRGKTQPGCSRGTPRPYKGELLLLPQKNCTQLHLLLRGETQPGCSRGTPRPYRHNPNL